MEDGAKVQSYSYTTFAMSPDWQRLAVSNQGHTSIYDPISGKELGVVNEDPFRLAFQPGTNRLACIFSASSVMVHSDVNCVMLLGVDLQPDGNDRSAESARMIICPAANSILLGHGEKCCGFMDGSDLLDLVAQGIHSKVAGFSNTNDYIHPGMDFAGPGSPDVFPLLSGEVVDEVRTQDDPDYRYLGYAVIVSHVAADARPACFSLYAHLREKPVIPIGEEVIGGKTLIGFMGREPGDAVASVHVELRSFKARYPAEPHEVMVIHGKSTGIAANGDGLERGWIDIGKLIRTESQVKGAQ
jgi:hypothetical protein